MSGRQTVRWGFKMEGVGLMAVRRTRGIPVVMPPKIPPARLVFAVTLPPETVKGSLFSEPRSRAEANPPPNSTPLTAGTPKRAAARRFSIPSNMGSPSPAGRPAAAHSTTPPTESPSCRAAKISACILSPAPPSSTGKGFAAISANSSWVGYRGKGISSTVPTEARWAPT